MSALRKIGSRIGIGLLVLFVVIQLFRPDYSVQPVDPSSDFLALEQPPKAIGQLIQAACYDCHSNQTVWPWYSQVAPISWWVADHVEHASGHLNFSEFGSYEPDRAAHKMEECFEELEEEEMPLPSYTWVHNEAVLTAEQRTQLIAYFKAKYAEMEGEEEHSH